MTGSARDSAAAEQARASDPEVSVFVGANAGAGKTHVLVSRIVRLLLGGVPPQRILCLTYTRAAAAEMASRLFERLSSWIAMSDETLIGEIHNNIGHARFSRDELNSARQLFTRALETPGGLKIQTIHAFCEHLLQRFPIESGVAPGFTVLDDVAQEELLAEARAAVLSGDDTGAVEALHTVIAYANEHSFDRLIVELMRQRQGLRERYGHGRLDQLRDDLNSRFGLTGQHTPGTIDKRFHDSLERRRLDAITARLGDYTTASARKATGRFAELASAPAAGIVATAAAFLLTTRLAPKSAAGFGLKKFSEEHHDLWEVIEHLQRETRKSLELLTAIETRDATVALVELALSIDRRYQALKARQSTYDYDDLIEHTVQLLHHNASADWVRYRLDQGLDHILVDEAQDTSASQWKIIEALTGEFFAGEGARGDEKRTVFAVGDRKQSIYSFQGANPDVFDERHKSYAQRAARARRRFETVEVDVSFRTCSEILQLVDDVFSHADASSGVVSELYGKVHHRAAREGEPGYVELCEIESGAAPEELTEPWQPVSPGDEDDPPALVLARRIAATIAGWLGDGEQLASCRPVRPGDILILVRERGNLMDALVRELRQLRIPVSGSDRLRLLEHIAIQDLLALGCFAILPDDDLNLAALLKSPLFCRDDTAARLNDDDDLFGLLHGRARQTLWKRLAQAVDGGAPYALARSRLEQWRRDAAGATAFEFYARVLVRDGAYARLLSSLGPDAADPIDHFLESCHDYERDHGGQLAGFLDWLQSTSAEIKRDLDQTSGQVRLMTVHGAKGLEAPIVILPDTCGKPDHRKAPRILFDESGVPVWRLPGERASSVVEDLKSAHLDARIQEYHRLLYVAMTRARDRLYVCGFVNTRARSASADVRAPEGTWYSHIHRSMTGGTLDVVQDERDDGRTLWRLGDMKPLPVPRDEARPVIRPAEPPEWARTAPAATGIPALWLSPSSLISSGDDAIPDDVISPLSGRRGDRLNRGVIVHRLLQYLPDYAPDQRAFVARRYLTAQGVPPAEQANMVDEVEGLLDDERLARIFSTGSRAEVPIVASIPLPDGNRLNVSGQIDRIYVGGDTVVAADFKTNRRPPREVAAVPEGYVRQLAAYRVALQQIYPGSSVECVLVWTHGPVWMELPPDLLDQAWNDIAGDCLAHGRQA